MMIAAYKKKAGAKEDAEKVIFEGTRLERR
jgi:hypothetical protein